MPVFAFPKDFLWGAATAAYQIEGFPLAGGGGPSIWHTFAHTPGRVERGETGDRACEHYVRWHEDIEWMQRIGLRAYRFSIPWARIFPSGRGPLNAPGMDFYDRLVDGLCAAGITPAVTLYHWDLPQALEDEGGWRNPDVAAWFADYAHAVSGRLGDRVRLWITLNEPWVFVWLGHALGIHAPGGNDRRHALAAAENVVRAHHSAYARVHDASARAEVGIALSMYACIPASQREADAAAVARARAFYNDWFLDALLRGVWPEAVAHEFAQELPALHDTGGSARKPDLDFVGVNYYTRQLVADDPAAFFRFRPIRGLGERTEMDWEVYPPGLYHVLTEVYAKTALPLYVTENGAAFGDPLPDAEGVVSDDRRLRYLQSHIENVHRACAEGVDVRGYFVWSLLDNFEWTFGYEKRFGILRCDFETQQRSWKKSGLWYRDVIANGGI